MLRLRVVLGLCLAAAAIGTDDARGQWYGSTDFLLMRRNVNTDPVFQREVAVIETRDVTGQGTTTVTDTFVGDDVLSVEDIDFGHNAAGRIRIGRRFGEFGIESSFLWVEAWEGAASVSDPNGNLVGPFVAPGTFINRNTFFEPTPPGPPTSTDDPQPAIVHLNTYAEIFSESKLHTGDINFTALLTGAENYAATLLAGVRYADLSETFAYESFSAGPPGGAVFDPLQGVRTRNRLIGPQLGLVVVSEFRPGLAITVSGKTSLAYNRITRDLDWSPDLFDSGRDLSVRRRQSGASFLGEFGVRGMLAITPNLSLHAGYEVLALGDVALAADNFVREVETLDLGRSTAQSRSRAIYGAPVFGLGFVF